MEKNTEKELIYYEHHIQYLLKELDAEERYRTRLKNARAKYEHNVMVSNICAIIIFSIFLAINLIVSAVKASMGSSRSSAMMGIVMDISVAPLNICLVIGFVFCLIRLIWGLTKIKGMTDPKTMTYQRYETMQTVSEQRSIFLQRNLLETVAKNEAVKAVLREKRNSLIESKEMKAIDFSELRDVQKEKENLDELISE